jgi:uncharacterized protein YgiM (DUF1202 family)
MIVDRRLRRRAGFLSVVGAGIVALAMLPGTKPATTAQAAAGTAPSAEIHLASAAAPVAAVPVVAIQPATITHVASIAPIKPVASTSHASFAPTPDTSTVALPAPDQASDAAAGAPSAHIGGTAVNVHAGPSNGSEKLAVAQAGEPVAISGSQGAWVHIVRSDGSSGWVYSSFLSSSGQ